MRPSDISCSYSWPPCPLEKPNIRWYQALLASTSRTAMKGGGIMGRRAGRSDGCVTPNVRVQPPPKAGGRNALLCGIRLLPLCTNSNLDK